MTKTFISYAREDSDFAIALAKELRAAGAAIWIDQLDIPAGKRWDLEVQAALESCQRMLVILTPVSIASNNVMDEVHFALEEGKEVIPILHKDCSVPFRLRRFQRADVRGGTAELLPLLGVKPSNIASSLIQARTVRTNPKDGLEYVWIPPGEFLMGASPEDDEEFDSERPPSLVKIAKGFCLGKTPVTAAAYDRFLQATGKASIGEGAGYELPVANVNWDDAMAYCLWVGLRLPTDAEWEYAARAGATAARYGELDRIAWYLGNSRGIRHPVAQKDPNAWGLYDMLGNVWEWTTDDYGDGMRVIRGGSFADYPRLVRVSYRNRWEPASRYSTIGFRCAGELR